jgi:hypothetical protein
MEVLFMAANEMDVDADTIGDHELRDLARITKPGKHPSQKP